jgi:hypothetical protein
MCVASHVVPVVILHVVRHRRGRFSVWEEHSPYRVARESHGGPAAGAPGVRHAHERGMYEEGKGGRSSVSGITVAVFGGTGLSR